MVNNGYRPRLEEHGMVFSGTSPDGRLVEYVELAPRLHPFYVGTQAHPELRSRPTRAHPLFVGLVAAAIDRQRELRLPVDDDPRLRRPAPDEDGSVGAPMR
jgi:CTP synthase